MPFSSPLPLNRPSFTSHGFPLLDAPATTRILPLLSLYAPPSKSTLTLQVSPAGPIYMCAFFFLVSSCFSIFAVCPSISRTSGLKVEMVPRSSDHLLYKFPPRSLFLERRSSVKESQFLFPPPTILTERAPFPSFFLFLFSFLSAPSRSPCVPPFPSPFSPSSSLSSWFVTLHSTFDPRKILTPLSAPFLSCAPFLTYFSTLLRRVPCRLDFLPFLLFPLPPRRFNALSPPSPDYICISLASPARSTTPPDSSPVISSISPPHKSIHQKLFFLTCSFLFHRKIFLLLWLAAP